MQVTLISSHYLIKHDLTNTSLMNIYINKLNETTTGHISFGHKPVMDIYHLDINYRWTYITWTRTTAGCVIFGHKPQLDMYYLDLNHCWTYITWT